MFNQGDSGSSEQMPDVAESCATVPVEIGSASELALEYAVL
jgi:hypothetical protein